MTISWHKELVTSNVAVSIDSIQIQGICKEIGIPLDICNEFFAKKYKKYYNYGNKKEF